MVKVTSRIPVVSSSYWACKIRRSLAFILSMKSKVASLFLACLPIILPAKEINFAEQNDVTWNSPGKNENDSMPVGNGDIAANVWTEQNGDLVLLVAKSDAWTELGKLVKLGRVRIHIAPNPFAGAVQFTQTLHLEDGSIEIRSGTNVVRVWVDA